MRWLMVCLAVSAAATAVTFASASAIERSSGSGSSRGVLLGVSGNVASFKSQTGQSSTVVEVFLGWGQGLMYGSPFAELLSRLGPIPMLHLGTRGADGRELITPAGIASGLGDSYLIALSRAIAEWGKGIYIRPLAEMNNSGSAYSAYNKDGTRKDAAHSAASYRKAFERIYLILHGGSLNAINAKMRGLALPPVKGGDLARNPFPGLRIVWSPLAGGLPRTGNSPSMYYPGDAYVDVEGGDIYDESLTDNAPWTGLEALYRAARSHGKPFSVPEWGLFNVDDTAFIGHMCRFLRTHRGTEMQAFFEGKPLSIFNLDSKPKSREVYRQCITPLAARIPGWAKPRPTIKTDVLTLTPSPTSGSAPLPVQFAIAARLSSPIRHWQILFGDGAQIEGTAQPPTSVQHSYAGDGIYKATLFVYPLPPFTIDTARFLTSADVTVGIGDEQPVVAFKATPVAGSEPLKVVFQTDLKLPSTVAHWRVVLDDGFVLQGAGNPPHFTGHTYDRAGTFRPRLIIDSSQNGQLFAYANVVITGAPPSPPPPPATATATGTVVVNGKPFTGGTLPYGSHADVTDGTLTLKTAVGTVTVYGGGGSAMFMLLRKSDRGKPIDELRLVGGNFATCKKGRQSASVHSKRPPPRVVRSLWGKAKGRFRTRGRTAVVSVRGTIWLTADRCDGTLTTVKRGVVEVRDILRKKTVIVQAGQSYLARSK